VLSQEKAKMTSPAKSTFAKSKLFALGRWVRHLLLVPALWRQWMNTDSGKANLLKSSMNDRMHELRLDMGGAELTGGGPSSGGSNTAFMQAFFDEVAEVKRRMSTIRHNMGTIEEYHGECLTAISSEQGKEATARLDRLMVETNQIAQQETKNHIFSVSP
jgi:hypothetical protein